MKDYSLNIQPNGIISPIEVINKPFNKIPPITIGYPGI